MKKTLCLLILSLFGKLYSNNLIISGVSTPSTTTISFTIKWDNSWNVAAPSFNYDAVWVFVKTQVCVLGSSPWIQGGLSIVSTDHSVGGGVLQVDAVSDGMGVFIHRNTATLGTGNIAASVVTLKFSSAYVLASTNFEVVGIEMVYVPQGIFTVGDGSVSGAQSANCWGTNNSTLPYAITSEAAFGYGTLRNDADNSTAVNGNPSCCQALNNGAPAGFPKGFNAFYCMKYEISQEQYVTFLNLLDFNSQSSRTAVSPNSAAGTLALSTAGNENRNFVKILTPGIAFGTPAVYGYDLDNNGTLNQADDGGYSACNYLSWYDLLAYLDWAALRPMTELEFEKAARGTNAPIVQDYPWGSTTINQAISNSLATPGFNTETSTSTADGLCAYNAGASSSLGPLRVGFAATVSTTRTGAGASYYGAMDMGGNLWEQCMIVGYYNNGYYLPLPIFTGVLGDGLLDAAGNGNANPSSPGNWAGGPAVSVVRGGNWEYGSQYIQISDRSFASSTAENAARTRRTGGRGVR